MTALVTPFKDGTLDEAAFRTHVDWQIESGTHGLVPVGTTGESPTLSHDEHRKVVEWCIVRGARPRAGDRRRRLQQHRRGGRPRPPRREGRRRRACWSSRPITTSRRQEGLYQHFKAVNDAIGIPIIIYNIPPRSVIDMSVDTMKRLYELKNIAGVKDATGNVARVTQQRSGDGPGLHPALGRRHHRARLQWRSGGSGCISVVVERRAAPVRRLAGTRRWPAITPRRSRCRTGWCRCTWRIFLEPGLAGREVRARRRSAACRDEVRLPLVPATEPTRAAIRSAMVHAGLLNA